MGLFYKGIRAGDAARPYSTKLSSKSSHADDDGCGKARTSEYRKGPDIFEVMLPYFLGHSQIKQITSCQWLIHTDDPIIDS
jgi:hypothetical protein